MSEPATGIAPIEGHRSGGILRWSLLGLALVFAIAAVVLPLININRYHRTIAESLTRSVGRPVHLGSVQLQLLPHPGLALTDFVVEEDPGFGAEPLLRAPSVTVSLRFASLWRRRLEVSRMALENASLNLVRNTSGQWNFGSLLIQAARTPNAPTAQRHATAALRFPYIEFRSARINFKMGAEKKAFSFLNSDFSIWLAEPDQWRLRFEAQPARTDLDLDLADTGLMRLEGSLNRASALDEMQVKLHAEWSKAPLGQVSRMLFGQDSGWRGLLRAEADFAGDIRNLQMNTRIQVDDAHRQEFTPLRQLDMDARCRGVYQRATQSIDDLTCIWPVGEGHLLLTGSLSKQTRPEMHLTLEINHTPAAFAVSALGLLRRGLTSHLSATGLINGQFKYSGQLAPAGRVTTLSGQATVESLALGFPGMEKPVTCPTLHFVTPDVVAPLPHTRRGRSRQKSAYPHPTILLEAAPMALGASNPLELSGEFTGRGFTMRLAGPADLGRLAALSESSGLLSRSLADLTPESAEPAAATFDLTLSGPWMTSAYNSSGALTTQGWLRIEHAQAKLEWLPEPVEIASATANFSPGTVTWSNATFTVNGIAARGSLTHPLGCGGAQECAAPDNGQGISAAGNAGHFNLDIASLDAAALMGAGRHGELLSAILAQVERKTAPWPPLEGTVHVGVMSLGGLALHDARGTLALHGSRVEITSVDASTLGGSVNIAGTIETSGGRPAYSLDLNWLGVGVTQAAAILHERWGTGTINGKATLTLQGYSASDLASTARGTFQWEWVNGSIGAPPAAGALESEGSFASLEKTSFASTRSARFSPAHFSIWPASGTIENKAVKFSPADRMNPVTGSISFDRGIDLLWPTQAASTLRIHGTLAHPVLETPQTVSEH